MTKYSSDFKYEVVKDYLSNQYSYKDLCKKYNILDTQSIRSWVAKVKAQDIESLRSSNKHQSYSLDFKLSVVDYYKTSGLGLNTVAAHFNINSSQVQSWAYKFDHEGVAGLKPRQRGRPSMVKKPKKNTLTKLPLSEKEKYEEEIPKLKEELYNTQMEHDFLKKLEAVLKNNQCESNYFVTAPILS